ncbi:HAMP domain-containing histidine kinase [Tyzzerella sp. OttesenSCG-928-J15]|nr:HAMP domain-containing histidine kinase [Tyzzerella sp. OttesenSCG-928-J15]
MLRNKEFAISILAAAVITISATIYCLNINAKAAVICFIACTAISAIFVILTFWRYKQIARLSDYLSSVTNGRPALDIRENAEGELSILKNEIYKTAKYLTEQAEVLQKDKQELACALSDISHQLKTPLTSLGIMSDLLEDENLPTAKRKEFVNSIRAGQMRMEWLVVSLLKLAKLDAGAAAMFPQNIALSALIEKAAASLLIPMEIKEQHLIVSGEDSEIICDRNWTAEALSNIIKNAVENTPQGGQIKITYGKNPMYAYITIHDSGAGIDKADLPHIFKRFYRGKSTGAEGVGIGLAMSLAILRKQRGDIEVSSDNGSVFTLKFYC